MPIQGPLLEEIHPGRILDRFAIRLGREAAHVLGFVQRYSGFTCGIV